MPQVRLAAPTDVGPLAVSLARAFADDPIWRWLVGDDLPEHPQRMAPFFRAEARHYRRLSGCWTTDGQEGAALWAPPGRWKMGPLAVAALTPPSLRLFGTGVLHALSALNQIDRQHPSEPHWYLGVLGTDPDHQGKGIGSSLLAPVLRRCDDEGMPAYLESSKEQNVPFYERHGFAVTGTYDFAKGPRTWLMWRDPRPPTER